VRIDNNVTCCLKCTDVDRSMKLSMASNHATQFYKYLLVYVVEYACVPLAVVYLFQPRYQLHASRKTLSLVRSIEEEISLIYFRDFLIWGNLNADAITRFSLWVLHGV
jgi:hypothetical protein